MPSDLPAYAAELHVDLGRIVANYASLSKLAGSSSCAAVVKADAYGLGASRIASAFRDAGCREFFVATLAEGLDLRQALGPAPRIFILNGLVPGTEDICAAAGLIPVLSTLDQCRAWSRIGAESALQVDSGMSRLGLDLDEQAVLAANTRLLSALNLTLLMSHLANADEPDHPSNRSQLAAFAASRARFPGLRASLANSAGIFLGSDYHHDLCRPGAALYGISAGPLTSGIGAVATLTARILQTRTIPAGVSVGYGYSFTAERPTRVATIGVGYADGWPRTLSGVGCVHFEGVRLSMLGRVSMDSFAVDITALPADRHVDNASVELIGSSCSVDDVATTAGTIGYEIFTGLGSRFHRTYGTRESAS